MISLPPRYVMVPAEEVYDRRLDDEYFRTLAQIRGLAYKTKGERTPVLTLDDLVAIRGLDRSNIYRHLALLREQGYIRTEKVGKYQFVIYPLRWEPGAALPTDGEHDFTDEEMAALFGSDGEKSRTDATFLQKSRIRATHHDHVVVLKHDSDHEQQHDFCRTGATNFDRQALLDELVSALVEAGMAAADARTKGESWLDDPDIGAEVCRRQLDVKGLRFELARASKRGLKNPVGYFCKSVEEDWPLPAAEPPKKHCWFTDEEAEQFFYHGDEEAA